MRIGKLHIQWQARQEPSAYSREVAEAIYANAPIMINLIDRNGRWHLWNNECVKHLGYTREELNAHPDPMILFYPEEAEKNRVLKMLSNPDGQFREFVVRTKDDRRVYQRWANFPFSDRGTVGVGYDVTDLRAAEAKLKALNDTLEAKVIERTESLIHWEEHLHLALQAGNMATTTWERNLETGAIQGTLSPSFATALGIGFSNGVFTGDDFLAIVHPDDREMLVRTGIDFWEKGIPFKAEYRVLAPTGERWIFGLANPVRNDEGKIVRSLGVTMDITDKKATERLLDDQQLKMLTSAKLSALGEMAGGIAHEINNPLSIINGNAGLLKSLARHKIFDQLRVLEIADRIESTVRRISAIVKSLKTIARAGEEEPMQEESLRQIISDTLEICCDRFTQREIRLDLEPFPDEVTLLCRSGEIAQILLNLLNNAVDAVENMPEKWVKISVMTSPESVEIVVTDSGRGIPSEVRGRVLEPFFTTKAAGKGTGLGLSISKTLAEKNRGDLRLDASHPHTRFIARFKALARAGD